MILIKRNLSSETSYSLPRKWQSQEASGASFCNISTTLLSSEKLIHSAIKGKVKNHFKKRRKKTLLRNS